MTGTALRALLSRNIKEYRAFRGFSQADLADRADISITFLSAIERGEKWPHPDTFAQIASALAIEPFDLLKPEKPLSKDLKKILNDLTASISNSANKSVELINRIR
jgi:transcriptional regulator with XRE-family HTH domain